MCRHNHRRCQRVAYSSPHQRDRNIKTEWLLFIRVLEIFRFVELPTSSLFLGIRSSCSVCVSYGFRRGQLRIESRLMVILCSTWVWFHKRRNESRASEFKKIQIFMNFRGLRSNLTTGLTNIQVPIISIVYYQSTRMKMGMIWVLLTCRRCLFSFEA